MAQAEVGVDSLAIQRLRALEDARFVRAGRRIYRPEGFGKQCNACGAAAVWLAGSSRLDGAFPVSLTLSHSTLNPKLALNPAYV